jgi:hypothetical protein
MCAKNSYLYDNLVAKTGRNERCEKLIGFFWSEKRKFYHIFLLDQIFSQKRVLINTFEEISSCAFADGRPDSSKALEIPAWGKPQYKLPFEALCIYLKTFRSATVMGRGDF